MKRYECLQRFAKMLEAELVVTDVGPIRTEWEELRPSDANLYQAGMGNVIPLSLGLSLALPRRKVVALDGDGSYTLNPGSLATVADEDTKNLFIIIFDNECYEATGGESTATGRSTDIEQVGRGFGIKSIRTVRTVPEFIKHASAGLKKNSLSVLVAKIEKGSPFPPIPRSSLSGIENKYRFVRYIEKAEGIQVIKAPPHK